MNRLVVIAAIAALALPAAATAATWSEPQLIAPNETHGSSTVDGPFSIAIGGLSLAIGPTGTAYASWTLEPGSLDPECYHCTQPRPWTNISTRAADGSWSPARRLPEDGRASFIGATGRSGVLLGSLLAEDGYGGWDDAGLRVHDSRRIGSPKNLVPVKKVVLGWDAAVAPTGDGVAAWTQLDLGNDGSSWVALRRRDGSFGRPVRVGDARPDSKVAINDRGDAVVASIVNGRVGVRVALRGKPFGPTRKLAIVDQFAGGAGMAVAIDDAGYVTVLYRLGTRPTHQIVLQRAKATGRFSDPVVIDTPSSAFGGIDLKAAGRGRAVASWESGDPYESSFRVANIRGDRADVRSIGGPHLQTDLDATPDGHAAVAWRTREGALKVALRVPAKQFGPEEDAFPGVSSFDMALDPTSGQPSLFYARADGFFEASRRP
jgi:hypothetical protein